MPRSIPAKLRRHPLSEPIARARRPPVAGSLLLCLAAPAFGAPVEIELSALGAGDGSQGFVLNGGAAEDAAGWSVSDAGDVNGDGTDDIIIGAHRADPGGRSEAGESYVVFGHSGAFPAALELSALQSANGGDGSQGFVLNGAIAGQYSGHSVGAAGDVNGDGIDDVIVGAPKLPPPGPMLPAAPGKSYVIFGHTGAFAPELELSSLMSTNGGSGAQGFVLNGAAAGDSSGFSVSAAGDVNGDGADDVIVGASQLLTGGDPGEAYVVFGHSDGLAPELALSTLKSTNGGDGDVGFVLKGSTTYERVGESVSAAGDVNGDAIDDIIVGAPQADPGGAQFAGAGYVLLGHTGGFTPEMELSSLRSTAGSDGAQGFVLFGKAQDLSGAFVGAAGDVNSDGIDDVIINGFIKSYLVLGHTSGFAPELKLSSLKSANGGNGTVGFVLNGADSAGSGAGDINGDGMDDVIVGAYFAHPNGSHSGASYVVFGADTVADSFGFTPVNDVLPDTWVSSNAVVVGSLGTSTPVSISGGQYAIDGGAFTADPGSVSPGASVVVQVLSSMLYSDPAAATLMIGTADGSSASFTVTTTQASLSISNLVHAEGDSGITPFDFTVSLDGPSVLDVMVDYTVSGITATEGVDFQQPPLPHSLTIPAGSSSGTLSVPVLGDTTIEPNEQFRIKLSNPQNASLSNTLAVGTIENDDGPKPLFADGFESGDTSAWSTVAEGS